MTKNEGFIEVLGARVHNLKNIDVRIPRENLVVITGLSGSGKSSLAFDTIYAEGQRRYIETFSAYARQFMGKLDKPDVDRIDGISPAIAIEQKVVSRNARSTVGTSTEIYDYIKLLYARIGKTISPVSGQEVKRHQLKDVVHTIEQLDPQTRLLVAAPVVRPEDRTIPQHLDILLQQGYSRVLVNNSVEHIEDLKDDNIPKPADEVLLLIDRVTADTEDEENLSRISDSLETAFAEGHGICYLFELHDKGLKRYEYSNRFELDGMTFEEPTVHFFTFNNPVGACKTCEGFGSVIGIDPDAVIPDTTKSIHDEAVVCWKGEKMSAWRDELELNAHHFDFPVHRPWRDLTPEQKELVWSGNEYFKGIHAFFKFVESNAYKIQYRVMLSRYRGKTLCPDCKGTRLRKDANYVKVAGKSISDLVQSPVERCLQFFEHIPLDEQEMKIGKLKILVVEDIALNQLLMRTLLDNFGFECEIANNGKIAIEKLETESYDLILMDLQMPEMNGFEATEFIRKKMKSNIPIMALTADVTTTDLAKCKAVGMNDYIAKPVDDRLLHSKIIKLVKKHSHSKGIKRREVKQDAMLKCCNLDYLIERTRTKPILMTEMITLYLEQTPILLKVMKDSLVSKDWDSMGAAAHKMIPSFSIMGIHKDYEAIAKRVQEFASSTKNRGELPELISQLEKICAKACEELKEVIKNSKNEERN